MLLEIAIRFTFEIYINIYICGHLREIGHLLSNKAQIQPTASATLLGQFPNQPNHSNILTDKRNATKELGLFEFIRHDG